MDKHIIMYQLFLRMFTKDGTLKAAEERLSEVKNTGANVLYLCLFFTSDESPDGWSERQVKSGMNNPKNPYRIKDYYNVDPEYGTAADLKSFVKKAHSLGMKVLFDLVYMHCGPQAEFITTNPDFVERTENGEIVYNHYHFPVINFKSHALREYLFSNMEYLIKEFDADGFRCDVGDAIPLDFWKEAKQHIKKCKSDIIMLNEGMNSDYLSVFDLNYSIPFNSAAAEAYTKGESAEKIKNTHIEWTQKNGGEGRCIYYLDNHDTASDCYYDRYEKLLGSQGMENVLFMIYTLDGIPMLYNGNEVCDISRHSLWSNKEYGGLHINWNNEASAHQRLDFLEKMTKIRLNSEALCCGKLTWLDTDNNKNILAYIRESNNERFAVIINIRNSVQNVSIPLRLQGEVIIGKGISQHFEEKQLVVSAKPYAYELIKLND